LFYNSGLAVCPCADFSLTNYSSTRVYTKISGERILQVSNPCRPYDISTTSDRVVMATEMLAELKVAGIWR
jgi:hypothetical protein